MKKSILILTIVSALFSGCKKKEHITMDEVNTAVTKSIEENQAKTYDFSLDIKGLNTQGSWSLALNEKVYDFTEGDVILLFVKENKTNLYHPLPHTSLFEDGTIWVFNYELDGTTGVVSISMDDKTETAITFPLIFSFRAVHIKSKLMTNVRKKSLKGMSYEEIKDKFNL